MKRVIFKRFLQIIPTILVVVTLTFIATRMIPGDPIAAMIGDQYDAAQVEQLREEFGFNDPMIVQYKNYLVSIAHGDFGQSYYFKTSAMKMISERLPNTLALSLTSLLIAILIGVVFGVVSAKHQSTWIDYLLTVLTVFGVSAPVFWVALMLVSVFSVQLGWFPTFGMGMSDGQGFLAYVHHMALPCICLSIIPMATFCRITRSSMIDALGSDSIRAIRARGIGENRAVWKHALKNALPPIITVIGIQFAGCFSGAVLTENIFSWPGMGTMISSAIDNRDYSLIQATVLIVALAFVVINLITDVLYMVINPKVAADIEKGGM